MKNFILLTLFIFAVSACKKDTDLPEGMEWVSHVDHTHFVYAPETYLSEEVNLREAGKTVCTAMFDYENYCEVYFWYKRSDVVTKFPITNRETLFAIFELKDGIMQLKKTKERKK